MAGSITIARHGEPALSRKVRLTREQYRRFWSDYEVGGLKAGQPAPGHLIDAVDDAHAVFVSTRRRALESARILLGERAFEEDARLIEAPLPPPPFPAWLSMSPKMWGFFARVWWWWFDHHEGQESRKDAVGRAREMAAIVSARADAGDNVLVVAHGFFNAMLGFELRRLGWKRVWGRGYKYWSTRRFERR